MVLKEGGGGGGKFCEGAGILDLNEGGGGGGGKLCIFEL